MRSPIVAALALAAMACWTGSVVAAGGGGGQAGGSASQSEYRPPVPSVDKRCPKPNPPGPPIQLHPLELHSGSPGCSFFDVFVELPPGPPFEPPGPPPERPPVPSIDKRFPPPGPRGK
jgi:hypothetical protein